MGWKQQGGYHEVETTRWWGWKQQCEYTRGGNHKVETTGSLETMGSIWKPLETTGWYHKEDTTRWKQRGGVETMDGNNGVGTMDGNNGVDTMRRWKQWTENHEMETIGYHEVDGITTRWKLGSRWKPWGK